MTPLRTREAATGRVNEWLLNGGEGGAPLRALKELKLNSPLPWIARVFSANTQEFPQEH